MIDASWHAALSEQQVAAVESLLDRVRDADGVSAVSEHTHLHIRASKGADESHLLLTGAGHVLGYAHLAAGEPPVAELLVDPEARGRGLGTRLLSEVFAQSGPTVRVWAHGQLPAAASLAGRNGLVEVRRLCRYVRPLLNVPSLPIPAGFQVRNYTPADASSWLDLNAAAFRDLPDQGSWTADDLADRTNAEWFDPEGFLLAFDEQGLAGFHWTKVHGGTGHAHSRIGEVYVLAVAQRARGTGLAPALTVAGLRHLRDLGLSTVMLYVDSSNHAAVAMYTRLGFEPADCDVQYARGVDATAVGLSGTLGT
ncbi:MAG: mycothiol synthase [Candidatus Nanopelagicales bacterium]